MILSTATIVVSSSSDVASVVAVAASSATYSSLPLCGVDCVVVDVDVFDVTMVMVVVVGVAVVAFKVASVELDDETVAFVTESDTSMGTAVVVVVE